MKKRRKQIQGGHDGEHKKKQQQEGKKLKVQF